MNARQKRFADNYLETGNITQSAIDAGYSVTYANSQGYRLLENVGIKKYLDKINKAIDSENIADMKEVKEFWASILRDDEQDIRERIKVSELIGKTNGAFLDKVEQTGDIGLKIEWVGRDET